MSEFIVSRALSFVKKNKNLKILLDTFIKSVAYFASCFFLK